MEFALNEIQDMFRSTAQKFFKEKCTISKLKEMEEEKDGHCPQLYKEIADIGLLGLIIPEEFGGAGANLLDLALVVEEAGWAALPGAFHSAIAYGILPILHYGTEEQKNTFLPKLASGERIVTGAFSEAQAHYDMTEIETAAVRDEQGGYTLSGTKLFVPYAENADYLLTLARTDGGKGLGLFLTASDQPGIQVSRMPAIGSDSLYEVNYDGAAVQASQVLHIGNDGLAAVQKTLQYATALQAIEMAGILRRAVDVTNEYVKERKQFGRAIGSFQAVQHRLADMLTIAEGGRLAAYHAVWRLNEGLDADKETATAKAFLSMEGQNVLVGAHQLHGGMGIDLDYPLQFCFRRFKSAQVNLGTAAVHLETIGRKLPEKRRAETLV